MNKIRKIDPKILRNDLKKSMEFIGKTLSVLHNLANNNFLEWDTVVRIEDQLFQKSDEIKEKLHLVEDYIDKKEGFDGESVMTIFFPVSEEELETAKIKAQEVLEWWRSYDKYFFKCDFEIDFGDDIFDY